LKNFTITSKSAIVGIFLFTTLFCIACSQSAQQHIPFIPESETAPQSESPQAPSSDLVATLSDQVGVERITYHIGPINLTSKEKSYEQAEAFSQMNFKLDHPMWVLGFEPKVVTGTGEELPAQLLKRVSLINKHEDNILCKGKNEGNTFAVANSLLTKVNFPKGYGYPLLPSDPIEVNAHMENNLDQDFYDVYVEITLVTKPLSEFGTVKDLTPLFLNFDPCNDGTLDITPESLDEKTASYELPLKAKLVFAHAVIDDYGVSLELLKNQSNDAVWEADADLDADSHIINIENNPFEDPQGTNFKSGDEITLGVTYNNSSDQWLYDSNAAAMLYFSVE